MTVHLFSKLAQPTGARKPPIRDPLHGKSGVNTKRRTEVLVRLDNSGDGRRFSHLGDYRLWSSRFFVTRRRHGGGITAERDEYTCGGVITAERDEYTFITAERDEYSCGGGITTERDEYTFITAERDEYIGRVMTTLAWRRAWRRLRSSARAASDNARR